MKLFWVSLLATSLLVGGCIQPKEEQKKEEEEEEVFPPINTFDYTCPSTSVVTYENFAQSWILRQCVPCHSVELQEGERADAPLGVDFNTYAMVRQWADNMFLRAAYNHETMPPAGGPYPEDRVLFGDWMACQAPREQDVDQN
jgi:hypothetical protein